MCRWLAYSGTPVLLEELLYKPQHSLIDQSLHSRLGAEDTFIGAHLDDAKPPGLPAVGLRDALHHHRDLDDEFLFHGTT